MYAAHLTRLDDEGNETHFVRFSTDAIGRDAAMRIPCPDERCALDIVAVYMNAIRANRAAP